MKQLISIITILLWASMAWGGMSAPRKLVNAAAVSGSVVDSICMRTGPHGSDAYVRFAIYNSSGALVAESNSTLIPQSGVEITHCADITNGPDVSTGTWKLAYNTDTYIYVYTLASGAEQVGFDATYGAFPSTLPTGSYIGYQYAVWARNSSDTCILGTCTLTSYTEQVVTNPDRMGWNSTSFSQ